jgi:hypothetical protein
MSLPKVIIFSLFLFVYNSAFSQTLTNSPYSRYGIGDIIENSISQSQAMGGIDQGMRYSAWINYNNPASYSALELSTLQTGLRVAQTERSTQNLNQKTRNGNMTSLTLGIPLKRRWGLSFGLLPYSGVGYKISNTGVTSSNEGVNYLYNGSGGLNRVYLGTAVSPFLGMSDSSWLKGFSIGANVSYLFGTLNYERRAEFVNTSTNYLYNLRVVDLYELSDFYLDYGIQHKAKINKKWILTSGITFSPATKISGKQSGLTHSYYLIDGFEYSKDTISFVENIKGTQTLPARFGGGLVAHYSDRIAFGFDYKTQNWSKFESFGKKDSLQNSSSISIGAQYIPNPANGRGFWQHVQYRLGLNYTSTYLKIRSTQLTEQSINFGAGIPIIKSLSTLNVAFQYGTRGTIENNLIREKFYGINLGLTFSDKWFIKRKFD